MSRPDRPSRPAPDRAGPRRGRLIVLAGLLAIALVAGLVALTGTREEAPPAAPPDALAGQDASAQLLAGIPQDGRFLGAASAPVTLVEFADLQCPFCARFARDALPTIIRDYVRPGRVRLEFRPRTFLGPDSVVAARVAMGAAQEDKLWNVLDLLFANQGAENSGWVEDELIRRVLDATGIDPLANRRAANSADVAAELEEADLLAQRTGLEMTPAFLVGRRGGAFQPLRVRALTGEIFSAALDEALAGAV